MPHRSDVDELTGAPVATGNCNCGKCTVKQRIPGGILGGHVQCHCQACIKRATKNTGEGESTDYAVMVPDWCCNVSVSGPKKCWVSCGQLYCCGGYFCMPFGGGLLNYECTECGQFLSSDGLGALSGLSAANGAIINRGLEPSAKTTPVWNQYYNSGRKPFGPTGQEGVKTIYADCPSFANILSNVQMQVACFNCKNNCCCCAPPAK